MNSALQKEILHLEGLPLYAGIGWLVLVLLTLIAIAIVLSRKSLVNKQEKVHGSSNGGSKSKGF